MYYVAVIMLMGFSARIVILKVDYFESYATCLECYWLKNFSARVIYEYELIEAGKKVIYKNGATAFGYPKKGKRYKVLIHKNDHNKICAKSEITACIVGLCIIGLPLLTVLITECCF